MDGTVLQKPVAARQIKLYHYRKLEKPIVIPQWKERIDDEYEDIGSDEEDPDSYNAGKVIAHRRVRDYPEMPKPWDLRGHAANEYWIKIWDDWKSGETERRLRLGLPSPWEEAIEKWNAEDAQFWNYKWDFEGIKIDDIPRWKTRPSKFPVLFQWKIGNMWLPPGPPTYAATALFMQHEQDACDALLLLGKINVGSSNIVPNMEKDNADC